MSPSLQIQTNQGNSPPMKHAKHRSVQYFTPEQVRQHDTPDDLWMIIYNKVYDVTTIAKEHPGGIEVLFDCGGEDATESFEDVGHSDYAFSLLAPGYLGEIIPAQQIQYSNPQPQIIYNTSKPDIKSDDIWNLGKPAKKNWEWL
ncbi:uncharacterized protein SPAPADRAFT_60146, partial [Spathaspora passalidarum NRRL Y-27907]